jgi:hypothetical protein
VGAVAAAAAVAGTAWFTAGFVVLLVDVADEEERMGMMRLPLPLPLPLPPPPPVVEVDAVALDSVRRLVPALMLVAMVSVEEWCLWY